MNGLISTVCCTAYRTVSWKEWKANLCGLTKYQIGKNLCSRFARPRPAVGRIHESRRPQNLYGGITTEITNSNPRRGPISRLRELLAHGPFNAHYM